jgi:hypothetical protein
MIISILFFEIIFCLQIQRWMTIIGSLDLTNHLLQEFILFVYRFFGLGINIWILIFFWNKKDLFIAKTHEKIEIIPSLNSNEGGNGDESAEIENDGRIDEVEEEEEHKETSGAYDEI